MPPPGLADPYYGEQWALEAIRAQEAWERASAAGAAEIIVAVADTAIDFSQPDLADPRLGSPGGTRRWRGHGLRLARGSSHLHGTGVAGVIGAIRRQRLTGSGVWLPGCG